MKKQNPFKKGYVYLIKDQNFNPNNEHVEIAICWGCTGEEFECCVCGRGCGHTSYRFDFPYRNEPNQLKEALEDEWDGKYENPFYGLAHLPTFVECLGSYKELREKYLTQSNESGII